MSKRFTVLVTGTSRGIGYALAEKFLALNYFVIGCSRGSPTISHQNYRHFEIDLKDTSKIEKWIQEIDNVYGGVDILVNNAGIYLPFSAAFVSLEKIHAIMDTNCIGPYYISAEVSKKMMQKKFGRIINISSFATSLMAEGTAAYTASKAALVSFSKVLAKELAPFNITCNVIGVSIIETDIVDTLPENAKNQILSRLAIKRHAEISDIYNAISFFASKDSGYVTGQVINLGFVD